MPRCVTRSRAESTGIPSGIKTDAVSLLSFIYRSRIGEVNVTDLMREVQNFHREFDELIRRP